MVEMGERFYEMMPTFPGEAFSPVIFDASLHGMLDRGDVGLFVHTEEGNVVGMAGVVLYPMYMMDSVAGQELFWWDEANGGRALMETMAQWAHDNGATRFHMASLPEQREKALKRIYESAGYRPAETIFVRAL